MAIPTAGRMPEATLSPSVSTAGIDATTRLTNSLPNWMARKVGIKNTRKNTAKPHICSRSTIL